MAVLKTSFRLPEINLGFFTSARGAGHLTPKKSLERGHLTKERAHMVGNLTKKIKNVKCPGVSPVGGAWASLDLTRTLPSLFVIRYSHIFLCQYLLTHIMFVKIRNMKVQLDKGWKLNKFSIHVHLPFAFVCIQDVK